MWSEYDYYISLKDYNPKRIKRVSVWSSAGLHKYVFQDKGTHYIEWLDDRNRIIPILLTCNEQALLHSYDKPAYIGWKRQNNICVMHYLNGHFCTLETWAQKVYKNLMVSNV